MTGAENNGNLFLDVILIGKGNMKVKNLLTAVSILSLLFAVPVFVSAEPLEAEKELSVEDINQKFDQIAEKYEVGDELSKEDAEFVKEYATPSENSVGAQKSQSFNKTGYTSGKKVGGNIKGNVTANHGAVTSSWGTNFLAKKVKGNITKVKASATHTAYGAVGSGGVGLVYKNSFSKTCNTTQCRLQESEKYSAVVAYSYTTAKGTFHYKSGSVSVTAP